jgi:hypothetical protein
VRDHPSPDSERGGGERCRNTFSLPLSLSESSQERRNNPVWGAEITLPTKQTIGRREEMLLIQLF